ncbi:MAG: Cys-tRNA(Pro) deacylase [Gordonia sp. (in: high G+C Gram-positive bacteria)]
MAATPAIAALTKAAVAHTVHRYVHDPRSDAYGQEAVAAMTAALGIEPAQIFKTLVIELSGATSDSGRRRGNLAVAVIPVPAKLSLKAAAAALGAAKAAMADAKDVTRSTGYVLGGVSPIGQRVALPTIVDSSAARWPEIFVSAGKRGLEVSLAPTDLLAVTAGTTADLTA